MVKLLVIGGIVPESLAYKHPGNMSHASYLATTNRILRLYVAAESPDENLLITVNFMLKVYAQVWFRIKCRPQFQNGPTHLFHMLNAM